MSRKKIHSMMDIVGVVSRFKHFCGVKLDREAAEVLGITEKNFNNQKKRGTIVAWIIDWVITKNVDLNWLLKDQALESETPGLNDALIQLKEIFTAKNEFYKRAIIANLQAFSEAIRTERRIESLEENDRRREKEAAERQTKDEQRERQIAELRVIVQAQLKAAMGRRSGVERRQANDINYEGDERRSGKDRRQLIGDGNHASS